MNALNKMTVTDIKELFTVSSPRGRKEEIRNRKEAETAIWGTDSPTQVPDDLNSILDIAEAIISLRNELQEESERAQQEEATIKENIQYIVGTTQEDVINYIKANLDYKSLSELSNA